MRLWLDTEFNGSHGALISMALVDAKGRHWYEVLGCADPVPWVAENVMPILNKPATTRERMCDSLSAWLRKYDSIHVVADWPEDFVHFCSLLVPGPGLRLVVPPLTMELLHLLERPVPALPHNALEDAKALRIAHLQAEARASAAEALVAKLRGGRRAPVARD